jgi:hypothetical protein
MFGVPIEGPANVFFDNDSVVLNTTIPTLPLKKKHNAFPEYENPEQQQI